MSRRSRRRRATGAVGTDLTVHVSVPHGHVNAAIKVQLAEKVRRALEHAPAPVLFARARLQETANPAVERPIEAVAEADVNGRVVRAHVAASGWSEAIDLLEGKLRVELEHLKQRRHARRVRPERPEIPGEWRHGDPPSVPMEHHPRPPDERDLVVRGTWVTEPASIAEAVVQMRLLGHAFELFTDRSTGAGALVAAADDGGLVIQVAGEWTPDTSGVDGSVVVRPAAARMHVEDAIAALDAGGLPFFFFVDAATGAGALVHHRYDGHIGLVRCAAASDAG